MNDGDENDDDDIMIVDDENIWYRDSNLSNNYCSDLAQIYKNQSLVPDR